MSTLPAAGYLIASTRTEGEQKVAFEDQLASIKQIPGAGVPETTLTIASGVITPPSGGPGIFSVDTEAATATDDLDHIAQTNIPDGSLILLRCANAARVVTVKTGAGGSGQIVLQGSLDVVLNDTKQWILLKRTGTQWQDVFSPTKLNIRLVSSTVSADPTVPLGVASKQYADSHGFTTGDVKLTLKTVVDAGWALMNDTTIGNGSSGATGRANADTEALFTLLWTNIIDTWAPVSGGRGASAAADFAANKTIELPKSLGRALAGYGTGTSVSSGVNADVDTAADTLTVLSNNAKWITGMPVVFTLSSGTITGLVTSTTYYIIRNSATLVKLASSLANAQNGVAIDLTAKSSPVWTITHTYTAKVLGERVGEEAHATSLTEMLAHTHGQTEFQATANPGNIPAGFGTVGADASGTYNTQSRGGNAAMNIMQPTVFLNVMVKL